MTNGFIRIKSNWITTGYRNRQVIIIWVFFRTNISGKEILKSKKMIIVPVKDGENIERALKKFKRKFEKTGVVKELRARQQYDKPSVLKRLKMEHAIYVQQLRANEE